MFLLKSLCTKGFYFNNHCFVSYNNIMFTVQHDNVRRSILANRIKKKGVTDSQGGHCILGSSDRGSQIRGVTVSSDTRTPGVKSNFRDYPGKCGRVGRSGSRWFLKAVLGHGSHAQRCTMAQVLNTL